MRQYKILRKSNESIKVKTEEEYIEDIIKNHDLEDYRERNIIY